MTGIPTASYPVDGEIREQWSVWHQHGHGTSGGVMVCTLQECAAGATEEDWARQHAAEYPESYAERRLVITTPWERA